MGYSLFFLLLLSSYCAFGIPKEVTSYHATFSGRVSRLNEKAALARVKIDFENAKYLNKKDKVEFWSDTQPEKRCSSYIEGRSNEYILIKIPQYAECVGGVHITTGAYLHFYSPDMERNMKVGRELLDILLKKKMALDARKHRYQKN
jgi:hypothetical protein